MSKEYSDEINSFLGKIFFSGDYLSHRTASGKEETGIRLRYDIDKTLSKEQVEKLYDLVLRGFDLYEHLDVDMDKRLKKIL